MTIPAAPLPGVVDLLRPLTASPSNGAPWLAGRTGREVRFFSRGSAALAAAAVALRERPSGAWQVWLPEYFCEDALVPMRRLGIALKFYPVREDLSPDLPANLDGPGAVVVVHYFGFPNLMDAVRAICRRTGLVLIEDAAHVLVPHDDIGCESWVVYSPRKLLALPSAGILICPENTSNVLSYKDSTPSHAVSWIARRMIQSALRTARLSWHRRSPHIPLPHDLACEVGVPSPYVLKLLAVNERRLDTVVRKRRENFLFLAETIGNIPGCRPMHFGLPGGVCPYVFPLRVHDAGRVMGALQSAGIPAYCWPNLPPEAGGKVARLLATETVLLPVHQSLLPREFELIRGALLSTLGCR